MAMMVDQQQSNKHHCRICKKGFGCGRALGGHMRAHGINDVDPGGEQGEGADDDPSGEWADDKPSPTGVSRRMYALRTNPNRPRACRVCENCGKEFSSWKSFLEHGRCADHDPDPDESLLSSPRSDAGGGDEAEDPGGERRGCMGWSKGKRSRRTKVVACGASTSVCLSSQEEDLANCLVMLSAGRMDPVVAVETEESCASASKEEDQRNPTEQARALPLIERPRPAASGPPRGVFECKACKKVFSSHQALGGHRASHKKVKGCFAARLDDLDESPPEEELITTTSRHHAAAEEAAGPLAIVPFDDARLSSPPPRKKTKLHECSICHRVFTSGQALGGHKRCHWITSPSSPDPAASIAKLHQMQTSQTRHHHHQQALLQLKPVFGKSEPLDLNLPAPPDDVAGTRQGMEAPLSLDDPVLFLHPWTDNTKHNNNNNNNNNNNAINTTTNSNNNTTATLNAFDDEADSKIKMAKLSDLKDLGMGGDSSSWLQVGIGPSTKQSQEP